MPTLPEIARDDEAVRDILIDRSLSHVTAARMISEYGYETTESSVRRTRKKLEEESSNHSHPKTVAVIGDYQIGLHDRDFIDRQCEILRDLKPDVLLSTGDELDFTSLGSWVQGLPAQYERTIHEERQVWVEEIAPQINEAVGPDCEKRMCDSNHLRRLPKAIEQFMPGARDMPELFVPNFMKLGEFGWHWDEMPYEFLPGCVYSHGDDWGVTSRAQAVKFRETVKTRQANIVYGHSHQAALNTTALGYGYEMETYWALNTGNGMKMREARYIRSTSPDWSRGIGIIHWDGESAHPELHLEIRGKIYVNGRRY